MKSLKIMFLLFAALLLFGCGSGAETKEESSEESAVELNLDSTIEYDKVAFEEGELLAIRNGAGEVIGYYERIDNPGSELYKGVAVYDVNEVEVYKGMPKTAEGGYFLYIKEVADGKVGHISAKASLQDRELVFDCEFKLGGKPYAFTYTYTRGESITAPSISQEGILSFDGEPVVYRKIHFSNSLTVEDKASSEFVAANPLDSFLFLFFFDIMTEIQKEQSKWDDD